MREILFRGKLKSNGEWSFGNLNVSLRGTVIITPDETSIGKYGQVIPETVYLSYRGKKIAGLIYILVLIMKLSATSTTILNY